MVRAASTPSPSSSRGRNGKPATPGSNNSQRRNRGGGPHQQQVTSTGTPAAAALRKESLNASNHVDDEDDDALDLSEQTNRPADVAINQQRVPGWQPILDPVWVIVALLYLGVILIPVGFKMISLQATVVELSVMYDAYHEIDPNPVCGINTTYNANRTCELRITVPEYMKAPVLVYYQLENFYQNYRKYYQSFDQFQLKGRVGNQDKLSASNCSPLNVLSNETHNITLNPCGLIANTFFNDRFQLIEGKDSDGNDLQMIEKGIAWQSDLRFLYAQPDGFRYAECEPGTCDTCCNSSEWSCTEPYYNETGCYAYFYPEDDTTQYLYETYPDIINPIEGVTNEHFVVWMKIATLNKFRNLYGWFNQSINAGEELVFRVHANYVVESFKGSKALLVSTNNIFGGRNKYTGPVFVAVGGLFLVSGLFFLLKHLIKPRRIADKSYLHYKQD